MRTLFIFSWFLLCLNIYSQERYTIIKGQKFRIKTLGTGTTTVIFENGMSDSIEVWGSIPDSVAKFASVFLYDRADIGKSDTSRQERTIPNVVSELRLILEKENISPPYVLVGHSLGGLITRYFVSNYPNEVKGLLLLDPSPEKFWNKMSDKELNEYIAGGNKWYQEKFEEKYRKEWYCFIPNLKYMENLNIPDDLPVILVSATDWNWYKFQKKIITSLNNAKQIELKGQHHIFKDHPILITKYIKALLTK